MLAFSVTVENNKVVFDHLDGLRLVIPKAIDRGLTRIAAGVYAKAFDRMSGASSGFHFVPRDLERGGAASGWRKQYDNAGDYPIPVRTGHFRRSMDWLKPGESKSGQVGTFNAGKDEAIVFNSASYALALFLGLGSSAKYGPRDAVKDGLKDFEQHVGIAKMMEEEIGKELRGE